jgi:DeoR/GlpR family transcriptional regulator of sugar metabolism
MGLVAQERQTQIIDYLQIEKKATVAALAHLLVVSEATVRRDLSELEHSGRILKTYGGAILSDSTLFEVSYQERLSKQVAEKQRIGTFAATLVRPGNSVFLDSGTTTSRVAEHLRDQDELTVVTNSLTVAQSLGPCSGVKLYLTGGLYRPSSMDLLGPVMMQSLASFAVDIAFLSVDGFHSEHGISASDQGEAEAARAAMRIAKRVVVVADSTKGEKRAFAMISQFQGTRIDLIVTDTNLRKGAADALRRLGIRVEMV